MSRALSILLVAGSAACASSTASKRVVPSDLAEYAPMAVGSSWTYDTRYPGQQGEMTVSITGEKDGYLVDDKNGAYRITAEGLRDRERYLIKNPLVIGTQWKTVVGPSAIEHAQITSVGTPCASAMGSFDDCLVVHAWIRKDEQMTLHIEWTWGKGVGLVKLETGADLTGKGRVPQVRQSLKAYAGPKGASPAAAPAVAPPADAADDAPGQWTKG